MSGPDWYTASCPSCDDGQIAWCDDNPAPDQCSQCIATGIQMPPTELDQLKRKLKEANTTYAKQRKRALANISEELAALRQENSRLKQVVDMLLSEPQCRGCPVQCNGKTGYPLSGSSKCHENRRKWSAEQADKNTCMTKTVDDQRSTKVRDKETE